MLIGILAWLGELDSVGKNFAVSSITVFYSAIYILAKIEPLKGAVKKTYRLSLNPEDTISPRV